MGGGGIHPYTPPPPLVRPRVKRKQYVFSLSYLTIFGDVTDLQQRHNP